MASENDKAMDGLTDEELEALKDTDEDEGDEDAGDEAAAAGEEDAGAGEGKDKEAAAAAAEELDPSDLRRDPAPILNAEAPSDAETRMTALAEEKAALVQKFDDGEITAREYSEGLEAIADKRNDIQWEKRKADLAKEANEHAIEAAWNTDVNDFMSSTGKKIAEKGEPALLAFDSYVKKVTGDPANARLSNRAQLEKAHKLFVSDFDGFGTAPKTKNAGDPPPNPKTGRKERVMPPSLAKLPAADLESTDDGKFARLDRLMDSDPIAYENAIARMTPAELAEYGL